ncbi:MAG: tRNA (guanosine(37)-N1)-methyltransferase TrmD [Clostridiales bacterium]|jgi:tRNA (guanine37-N1)-methyltransferase|nr:tRNA (guanosine(37)-N1)-methyltransferase TrmD [Clostridiales bacterium]
MRIDVLTLFPEMFHGVLGTSIIGRAIENKILDINLVNIRDFAKNRHKQTDDYPYGGGPGMVMSPQPLFDAFYHVLDKSSSARVIYFTPQGKTLRQEMARDYAKMSHLILLCGHYEGVDQRVIDRFVDEEISIGDYILTGGELPAMVFIDCVSRLIPGVLGSSQSVEEESFSEGLLEYPHYTRPQVYEGFKVPEVLLSGNHKEIEEWRKKESLRNTLKKRPDLLKDVDLTLEERKIIDELKRGKL